MTRRMYIMKPGEFVNEHITTYAPIPGNDKEIVRGFSDATVKDALNEAATTPGGFVIVVDETPTSYKSERIYACPECGFPLRAQGRGATLRKHGPRYVCPRAEQQRGVLDRQHAHVRAWSEDELEAEARTLASRRCCTPADPCMAEMPCSLHIDAAQTYRATQQYAESTTSDELPPDMEF